MLLRRMRGFTLIEMLIVLVILSILVGIAYPSYERFVQRGRRADAKDHLLRFVGAQERYYTTNNRYATAIIGGAGTLGYAATNIRDCVAPAGADAPVTTSENCFYTVAVEAIDATGQTYTLSATPINAQTTDACGIFRITNAGQRTFSGAESNGPCW